MLIGERGDFNLPYAYRGWAAKIGKTGSVIWNNVYNCDSTHNGRLFDMAELPIGGYIFVGDNANDTLPNWHQADLWLVGVDSNGCPQPGCAPTIVKHVVPPFNNEVSIKVYPNPAHNEVTITAPFVIESVEIMNLLGQVVYSSNNHISASSMTVTIKTENLQTGIYIIKVNKEFVQKMVKE